MWDMVKCTALAAGAGGRRRPAAALLFLRTHASVLWLSPEASRYKKVSCVGNGKRAKKTIWTWEGIWAGAWQTAGPPRGAPYPAASLPVARGPWPCSLPAQAVGDVPVFSKPAPPRPASL